MKTSSKIQTQRFAEKLAKKILRTTPYGLRVKVIALQGDLGTGKTTFTQGFLKALGVNHYVASPTFLIMRKYELPRNKADYHHAFHFDLYRIHSSKELLDLGFKKIISDPHAIILIEWPERVEKILPKDTIWISFEHGKKESERIIEIASD